MALHHFLNESYGAVYSYLTNIRGKSLRTSKLALWSVYKYIFMSLK